MSDEERMETAVRLLLAMMRSASTDRIKPIDWWTRAKSALETAAASAANLGEMVSIMGRKLQIDVTKQETASAICSIRPTVADDWEDFRRLCETQALYVAALAQGTREEQRLEWEAKNAAH